MYYPRAFAFFVGIIVSIMLLSTGVFLALGEDRVEVAEPRSPFEEIVVPVVLHPLRESGEATSVRTEENIRALFKKSQEIWNQAGIRFDVSLEPLTIDEETIANLERGHLQALYPYVNLYESRLHIIFLKDLNGTNGIALHDHLALVADITTVNDFRATAHEIGHMFGLGHTRDSVGRLMFQGVNGTEFVDREIEHARRVADELVQ